MTVEKIMNARVVTVEMDDNLKTIKEILDNVKFRHLLVVEDGKLQGVISDRDVLLAVSPNIGTKAETSRDLATLRKRAHQIMTRTPLTLKSTASVLDAVFLFNRNPISCIPIVNDSNEPVGIISWRDILKLVERELCEKLAAKP